LYQGQALTARLDTVRERMAQAADEENDHLVWCAARLRELGSHTSRLDPLWYLGSAGIGALAGIAGDKWSLGFVAETERQVVNHLDEHLTTMAPHDHKSRAILEQMKIDELHHGTTALEAGGAALPGPVKQLMQAMSKVMTGTTYWV
ncbi:MAG: 2-polyprenyl-3-methyl-6-methoxy-1,4-benzoquinone monooxygenase, partial [Gammaproteobacteria bacterium]|nr:2-polyprenyl-3-methyl-6-methoxy-1,4-benzoquinone monooxygenase [Gammaproteobacteria bacterium]